MILFRRLGDVRFFVAAVLGLLVLVGGVRAAGLTDGALRVEVITAYNLVVDSNAGTPSSKAPRSGYMGATFHNDGAVPLTDIIARIGNYDGGTNDTPGIYPSRQHDGLTGPLAGGAFALNHEGGSAGLSDATRYIASIPAGGSVTIYWLIGYPQLDIHGIPTWGTSVKPDDDLWLQYDVWATANEGATPRAVDVTRTVTLRNEISASANKIYPNGANKVPDYYKELMNQYMPSWTNVSADGTVGTRIVTQGIWYDLGNVGEGFDNDGNLVPDHNAWMQPIGDPSLLDTGAFRLMRTYAMVIVKLKTGGEDVLYGTDQLYFENIPENNGAVGYVQYEFMPLLAGARGMTTPYQEVASGRDNEKFNADYGVTLGELVSGESKALIDKTVDKATAFPGENLAYTITFTNAGTVALGDPMVGLPLVVQDAIPAGTVYVAGSATSGNTLPAGVSSYHVLFSTNAGLSWVSSEPAIATHVTHIQWWLDDPLPAADFGTVRFSVAINNPYLRTDPLIHNIAGLSFGNGVPFVDDDARTLVLGNNAVGDTVFADTGSGTGGYLGNGLQDGSETGLLHIAVWLYADLNNNGVVDAGDPVLASTNTASNGTYLFSNLPDGSYVVVVDQTDADMPYGYTVTTAGRHAVDLDSARGSVSGVSVLTADFGFAPALTLTKTRNGSGTLSEGQNVTYTLTVTNSLAGDGSGAGQPAAYTVWAGEIDAVNSGTIAGNSWVNPTNLYIPSSLDGRYATGPMRGSPELLAVSGFRLGAQLGSITNVKVLVPIVLVPNSGFDSADSLWVKVLDRANPGTPIYSTNFLVSALTTGTLTLDVTSARSWTWADFTTNFSIQLITDAKNAATAKNGVIDADAAGFYVMTDQLVGASSGTTTLDPVPLDDFFDPTRLQFVSAIPAADGVSSNGTSGTLHWDNIGPIYAGGGKQLGVTFKVLQPPGNISAPLTNTASVTQAFFLNGVHANNDEKKVVDTILPSGTIGDFVWRDLNTNGIQNVGEPGISGVTVQLFTNGVLVTTTVTDADGLYLFEGISVSNTYTVTVLASSLPGGAGSCTKDRDATPNGTTAFVLNPNSTTGGDTVLDADFGYNLQSLIRGTIWHDRDRDAYPAPESGEELLGGVTVRLYAADGTTLLMNTNTAADGTYKFFGPLVTNGAYVVKVDAATPPLGATWTQSFDTDGTGSASLVTLGLAAGGEAVADYSYYLKGTAAVGDTLFYDWDGQGDQDPGVDGGIADITVTLYQDENANGVVDAADAMVGTAVTSTNGTYLFSGLPSGTYLVVVNQTDSDFPALYINTYDPYLAKDGRSVVTVTTSTNLLQDFGYQPYGFNSIGDTVWFDANADGIQSGAMETGISNVTVRLYADLSGNGNFTLVATAATDANGKYLFPSLPDGDYRVVVDTGSAGLPKDSFGYAYRPTTATTCTTTVAGGQNYLDADFGFAPLGAIGDTIFWDNNASGGQDWNEPGIPAVTVGLFIDGNTNGVYDSGETQFATAETDALGKYLFSGLPTGYYVVAVDTNSTPLIGAALRSDPEHDGTPCPTPPESGPQCDNQTDVRILPGTSYMGADFGYQPPGVLGDLLWIDSNTNGVLDVGEQGIPYVTVALYSGLTLITTNVTDADGYYGFANLPDGTYRVEVLTNDTDFPAGLTPVFNADPTIDNVTSNIVMNGMHVTLIDGLAVINADLTIDFGYRYAGTNVLSGTVGMDDPALDGLLNGLIPNGVGAGEDAFANVTVYLRLWNDDGDNVVETNETIQIASTITAANGDYRFTDLPSGDGNDRYLVSIAAPAANLKLTTTTDVARAVWVNNATNSSGVTLSAYQYVSIEPVRDNIDFAFVTTTPKDYGDLPVSYSTTVANVPIGPSHTVTGNLYLGAGVDAESNGQPTSDASGDGADEDGVIKLGRWTDGGTGTVQVTVGAGSGWLVGWVDFNQDGTFTNSNERVINQAVSNTVYTLSFPIPASTFLTNAPTVLNARFRLYPAEPFIPLFSGSVTSGEVEDYQFQFGIIGDFVWEDVNGNGVQNAGEPGFSNVVVRLYDDNNTLLETVITDTNGWYVFTALTSGTYAVQFTAPTNFIFTTQNAGGDDALDSDANPVTGLATPITLTLGQNDMTIDAGFKRDVPTAAAVLIRAYATAEGVVVEFQSIEEAGGKDMILYLFRDGQWVEVGRQASAGEGNHRYVFHVPGLKAGDICNLMVRDDEGQYHTAYAITVGTFTAEAVLMEKNGLWLQWASLPDRTYEIQRTMRLGGTWQAVKTVTAIDFQTRTFVSFEPSQPSGFFKIVMLP